MRINVLVIIAALSLSACNKDNKPTYIEGVGTNSFTSSQAKNSATGMLMPQNNQPVQITPASGIPQVQIQPQSGQKQPVAPGMNPPHGEPGHRCDIAVGAPLNSSAKGNTQNAAPQQITINPSNAQPAAAPAAKQKTAPGMNPPHGEPGHRCDIAVGAPLNSPAGKSNTTPNVQTSAPVNIPATVAAPAPSGEKVATAAGMNPPHGEPGHRCDIAVGAPLK